MTLAEALSGIDIPEDIRRTLVLADVPYWSFAGEECAGQVVIHESLAAELQEIFSELSERRFPIQEVTPIVAYGWDDDTSMRANNTSAFNYRNIAGTDRLSNHSYGRALDINPLLNPYIRGGIVMPANGAYDITVPGTVTPEIAEIFKSRGWSWGGEWSDRKDWQHFEKG